MYLRVLVREPVVVLSPHMACQKDVEAGKFVSPLDFVTHLEPFGMLIEHRADYVNEGLIRVQKPVSTRQEIPFEPSFTLMLRQHFHDSTVLCQKVVAFLNLSHPLSVGGLEDGLQFVAGSLVGTEYPEVASCLVFANNVPQESTSSACIGRLNFAAGIDIN